MRSRRRRRATAEGIRTCTRPTHSTTPCWSTLCIHPGTLRTPSLDEAHSFKVLRQSARNVARRAGRVVLAHDAHNRKCPCWHAVHLVGLSGHATHPSPPHSLQTPPDERELLSRSPRAPLCVLCALCAVRERRACNALACDRGRPFLSLDARHPAALLAVSG